MKTITELKVVADKFYAVADSLTQSHPWAVCVAMHEHARTLYPSDPFIPWSAGADPTERVFSVTREATMFLRQAAKFGHYNPIFGSESMPAELKENTGRVYGRLWSKFSFAAITDDAMNILRGRFDTNGFDLNNLKGRAAIDIGCGSGRFSIALKKMGCKSVTGVDYGDDGLALARETAQKTGATEVIFRKADVLNLPYPDESFDFVFSSGVQHHTENMERGIGEMVRVAKKGAFLWLYLYGDGGIFWYARKKMPPVMKKIPQTYAQNILDLLGMPDNREMFVDNWYVPLERHTTDAEARAILAELGITKINRYLKGRPTDLENPDFNSGEVGRIMWGDGELRYMMEK